MSNRLWPGLLVATILLSVAGLGTHQNALSSFRSDFAARPVPTVRSTGKPLARAVYLVVIDGFGYRTAFSREMPFLGKLRDQAAWGLMTVDPPTYSRPGYARLLTGAPAELTALTMNDQRRPAPVPTIFGLASGSGLRTAASAHVWVRDLAGDEPAGKTGRVEGRQIQRGYYYAGDDEPDGRVFAAARDLVRQYDPALLLVLPMSLDAAGHSAGTSSSAYRESAAAVDAALADWHHSLPARDCILIVTGDHGHRRAGGHGGEERAVREVPFLICGPGIRPGRLARPLNQLDVAPTIAALLGLAFPGTMGGRVITEAFADEEAAAPHQEALRRAQLSYLRANQDLLGRAIPERAASFAAVWARARSAALRRRFLMRLPAALLMAAAVILILRGALRRRAWRWTPILAGFAYPLYFYALLRLAGADYSYSAIHSAADFVLRVAAAAAAALALLTWAGAALRCGKEPFWAPTALGVWTSQTLLTLAAWSVAGGSPRNFLPDLGWQIFLLVQFFLTITVSFYALAGWAAGLFRRVAARRAAAGG